MESASVMICVGAVVMERGQLLAVRQARGHPLEGQWTIPWGRLEPGESPAEAAAREVLEEAGVAANAIGLVGVQELPEPWAGSFALIYLCEPVAGSPAPDGRETDAAAYLSLDQIAALDEPIEPWSEWMMVRALSGEMAVIDKASGHPFEPHPGFV